MTAQILHLSERCPVCIGAGTESIREDSPGFVSLTVRICGLCKGRKVLHTLEAYEAQRKRQERRAAK